MCAGDLSACFDVRSMAGSLVSAVAARDEVDADSALVLL
jgi:hypothetical protein